MRRRQLAIMTLGVMAAGGAAGALLWPRADAPAPRDPAGLLPLLGDGWEARPLRWGVLYRRGGVPPWADLERLAAERLPAFRAGRGRLLAVPHAGRWDALAGGPEEGWGGWDLAWPDYGVVVSTIDWGAFDTAIMAGAQFAGWRVLLATPAQVEGGALLGWLLRAFGQEG